MNGGFARHGFRFQDYYLLSRLLPWVRRALLGAWRSGAEDVVAALNLADVQFGIEARAGGDASELKDIPAWDGIILEGHRLETIEAKSGEVTKPDRIAFWKRLRRTVASAGGSAVDIVPVLVVAGMETSERAMWKELGTQPAGGKSRSARSPVRRVKTGAQLHAEAIHWLTDAGAVPEIPSVPLAVAETLLQRLEVREHSPDGLRKDVEREIARFFPNGLSEPARRAFRDWLDERGSATSGASRLFPLGEFVRETQLLSAAFNLPAGTLMRWHRWRLDWRAMFTRKVTGRVGEHGAALPLEKVQPDAVAAAREGSSGVVFIGPGGIGKSTLLLRLDEGRRPKADFTIICPAANLASAEIMELGEAVGFLRSIAPEEEEVWLLVDALDEVDDAARRELWAQQLARLAVRRGVCPWLTMREADWNRESRTQTQLQAWRVVPLAEWPEEVVRAQLATASIRPIPPTLLRLLRTPIVFDLFWRTFVETDLDPPPSGVALPINRQQLLSAYWQCRVVEAPRFATLRDLEMRCLAIFAAATRELGSFAATDLDIEVLDPLTSESLLVPAGNSRERLQFRHPFLRDFAFARWVLAAGDANEAAARWHSIVGGLVRQGALRALLEALAENPARTFTAAEFVLAALADGEDALLTVAIALAALPPHPALDPSEWPHILQAGLPPSFGAELTGAVSRERGFAWAEPVARWSENATWLNDSFSLRAVNLLQQMLKDEGSKLAAEDQAGAKHLAGAVRRWSESSRFRKAFENDRRWLKREAIGLVTAILPDPATLSWLEREAVEATMESTQGDLLRVLGRVAHHDPPRAARVYRNTVGLRTTAQDVRFDQRKWKGEIQSAALELSLTGPHGTGGLTRAFPEAFLPVTLDMAEALYHDEIERRRRDTDAQEQAELRERLRALDLGPEVIRTSDWAGLIDDRPLAPFGSGWERSCVAAIGGVARHYAATEPARFRENLAPVLRTSRMASIHEELLGALAEHGGGAEFRGLVSDCLLDGRYYGLQTTQHSILRLLHRGWPRLTSEARAEVLLRIGEVPTSTALYNPARARLLFLAGLPPDDLSEALRNESAPLRAAAEKVIGFKPRELPIDTEPQAVFDDADPALDIGDWPADFDVEALREFVRQLAVLRGSKEQPDAAKAALTAAVLCGKPLLDRLRAQPELIEESARLWMWGNIHVVIASARELNFVPDAGRPFFVAASELALTRLSGIVRGDPDDESPGGKVLPAWKAALELSADAAMVLPSIEDNDFADRFGALLVDLFTAGDKAQQDAIAEHLRYFWHWLEMPKWSEFVQERFWRESRSGRALAVALSVTTRLPEARAAQTYRILLDRADLPRSGALAAALGQRIAQWSLTPTEHDRHRILAALADDVTSAWDKWPLLSSEINRRHFIHRFAFGLKETAPTHAEQLHLSDDYARWMHCGWKEARRLGHSEWPSADTVALFAICWLRRGESPSVPLAIRSHWWKRLGVLRSDILREGDGRDIEQVFNANMYGELTDIWPPGNMLSEIEMVLQRITTTESIRLTPRDHEDSDAHGWRAALKSIVRTLHGLITADSLHSEAHRDLAHRLLTALSLSPCDIAEAKDALHWLK